MTSSQLPIAKGRGSQLNPGNRFAQIVVEPEFDYFEHDEEAAALLRNRPTEYFEDNAQSIISENDSPDIPFRYSLNIYRGCSHGCCYCYARPTHEYLDLNAGLDFETKILVKQRAPELFRHWLARDGYRPEAITFSGVTDCYQPVERKLELAKRCLEVALESRQPISIVTKNALVVRDLDLLREMASLQIVSVAISVTTLDQSLTRVMEPRTSSPAARLRTIEQLSSAKIPVSALIAPVIPGLTDHEMPAILKAARDAGAVDAGYILLRLPLTVEPVFLEWLGRVFPDRKSKVETRLRSMRGGKLYEGGFGVRMKGRGELADQIKRTFELFSRRYGFTRNRRTHLDCSKFRRPIPPSGQRWLIDI